MGSPPSHTHGANKKTQQCQRKVLLEGFILKFKESVLHFYLDGLGLESKRSLKHSVAYSAARDPKCHRTARFWPPRCERHAVENATPGSGGKLKARAEERGSHNTTPRKNHSLI